MKKFKTGDTVIDYAGRRCWVQGNYKPLKGFKLLIDANDSDEFHISKERDLRHDKGANLNDLFGKSEKSQEDFLDVLDYAEDHSSSFEEEDINFLRELVSMYFDGDLRHIDKEYEVVIPRVDFDFEIDHSTEREDLVIKLCNEISGMSGEKPNPPDPVRLLEMAESLLKCSPTIKRQIK